MSSKVKALFAAVIAYAVTRLAYAGFQFHPSRDVGTWVGYLVDVVIFGVLFGVALWVLDVLVQPKPRS